MGLVTETLIGLIRKQVEEYGTVVWYDPEEAYPEVVSSLDSESVAGAEVRRYEPERGFIWLRHQLEPLWNGSLPPELIIYVPLAKQESHDALVEFEVAGVVMMPAQQPPECNTSLAAVARRALEDVLPPASLADIIEQVESGQLNLAELEQVAEKGIEAQTGAVAIIFGTGIPSEIALRFMSDDSVDAEIEAKQALGSLAQSLGDALGVAFSVDTLEGLRAQLARQILLTDLVEALREDVPSSLKTFPVAPQPVAREAAVSLARAWRNRRDLAESYEFRAGRVQSEIGGDALDLGIDALGRTETFLAGEMRLQEEVEAALLEKPSSRLVELSEKRLNGFWSVQRPEVKTRWDVIVDAGRVLVEAARVENALKGKDLPAEALLSRYAYGDERWCVLDTYQRHLERDFHRFDISPQQQKSLVKLVAHARQRYAAVSDRLAERFTRAYHDANFELPGILLQADVYREAVAEAAKNGPVAYILVDALRFEMACELASILEDEWPHNLDVALATPPTITEVGMAALMPGAEKGLMMTAENKQLAILVDGKRLKSRQDRVKHFEEVVEGKVVVTKLDQLAPLSDVHLSRDIESADVVLVTATEEVDGLCESHPQLARRMLDDVFTQLRRGIKALFGLGLKTVVISADHGYLFGERLTTGQSIDSPGGNSVVLKRRVWVGEGGSHSDSFMRAPLSAFGFGGELEIATPWNLSCFKVKGGGMEYFHGGLSLQELVIPVLTVRSGAVQKSKAVSKIHWTLTLGSRTISTRFLSVTVEGQAEQLFPIEPPSVRVEVQAEGQTVSSPVSASYGFDEVTGDVQLKPESETPRIIAKNTVTLVISETPSVSAVTIHLLDATTGVSLARLDNVPFSITL